MMNAMLRLGVSIAIPPVALVILFALPTAPFVPFPIRLALIGVAFTAAGWLAGPTVHAWRGTTTALVAAAPALILGTILTIMMALRPLDIGIGLAIVMIAGVAAAVGGAWAERRTVTASS